MAITGGIIAWENLVFQTTKSDTTTRGWKSFVNCRSETKIVLDNVNGYIRQGELLALMGPSGGGKSSLFNCLLQGQQYHGCSGKIYVVGLTQTVRACYIKQQEMEHLIPDLTVKQSLYYASAFKNTFLTNHSKNVEVVMKQLRISPCADKKVALCSGGEKKRIAVGLELTAVPRPHFLFLDEPTSGLDSTAGLELLEQLRMLTQEITQPMGIIVVIHQPSKEMLDMFSRCLIIHKGSGKFLYANKPQNISAFLKSYAGIRERIANNAIDTAISLASANNPETVKMVETTSNKLKQEIQSIVVDLERSHSKHHVEQYGICTNATHFWNLYRLWTLFRRTLLTMCHQTSFIWIRLFIHIVVALTLAILYGFETTPIGTESGCIVLDPKLDPRNCSCFDTIEELQKETKVSSNVKFQFFSLLFLMFASLLPTVLTFPTEVKLFLNEYRNGWYSTATYYITKTLTEAILQAILPAFYVVFLYWFTSQPGLDGQDHEDAWRLVYFLFISMLCGFVVQGLGFLIGIVFESFNTSIFASSGALLFFFLFSGFFIKRIEMGEIAILMTYFSFIRFGFESLMLVLFGNGRCSPPFQPSVLIIYDLQDEDLNRNFIWLGIHLLAIRLLAFIILLRKADPDSVFRKCDCLIWKICDGIRQYLFNFLKKIPGCLCITLKYTCYVVLIFLLVLSALVLGSIIGRALIFGESTNH